MKSFADRHFATVVTGIADAFWLPPLISRSGAARFAKLGLTDFGQVYFAVRSSPLGRVPAEVVTSAFFGFHPSKVRRYIPSVWNRTTPEEVHGTLVSVADETLGAALGDWVGSPESEQAAALLRQAAEQRASGMPGRPLFAAYSSLRWPDPAKHHLMRAFCCGSSAAILTSLCWWRTESMLANAISSWPPPPKEVARAMPLCTHTVFSLASTALRTQQS